MNFLARKGQQACRAGGAGGYAEMCRAAKCGFVTQGENFAAAPWYVLVYPYYFTKIDLN